MHIAWKSPSPMVHGGGSLVVDLLASSHSPFFLSQSFVPSLSFSLFLSSDYKTMVNPHQKCLFFSVPHIFNFFNIDIPYRTLFSLYLFSIIFSPLLFSVVVVIISYLDLFIIYFHVP